MLIQRVPAEDGDLAWEERQVGPKDPPPKRWLYTPQGATMA